jgi:hypothetical protein
MPTLEIFTLLSGPMRNAIWLSRNLVAYQNCATNRFHYLEAHFSRRIKRGCCFGFDDSVFQIYAIDESSEEVEMTVFDMLLESLGRRRIQRLKVKLTKRFATASWAMFSTATLRQFMTRNEQLRVIELGALSMLPTCTIIAQKSHRLKALSLDHCELDVEQFVNLLGEYGCGPRGIVLDNCNAILWGPKKKAAWNFNQGLEVLTIRGNIGIQQSHDLMLLFRGIAGAPNLRTLILERVCVFVSRREVSEMFLNALIACKNYSLESATITRNGSVFLDTVIWERDVIPILQFSQQRRQFLAKAKVKASGYSEDESLMSALMSAQSAGNHHFLFWLVRNHAGALRRGESVQVQDGASNLRREDSEQQAQRLECKRKRNTN